MLVCFFLFPFCLFAFCFSFCLLAPLLGLARACSCWAHRECCCWHAHRAANECAPAAHCAVLGAKKKRMLCAPQLRVCACCACCEVRLAHTLRVGFQHS